MVNLFKPTTYTAGAALAVGATLAWKAVSFANALLIALYYGAGRTTDVYFYLIMVMGFGVTFLQRMNAAAVIPEAMAQDARAPGAGRPLLNGFFYFYAALALLLAALGFICPVALAGWFSRFETAQLAADKTLLSLGFLLFGTQLLTSYLISVLEMHRRFASALLTPLNALLPLFFLVVFGRSWGVISMIYGFLAANAIQIAAFLFTMKKELAWNFTPSRPGWKKHLTKNLASSQLIELANIVSSVLPLYLLSGLSAGFVSALNYAKQLSDSPTEIFTLRVTNVSKIQLTESAARGDWKKLNADFLSTQHFLLFLLTPLAVFTCFYAPEIITLFFKRGNFTPRAAHDAAAFLRPLVGMMWFMAPIMMQNNIVAAGRKLKESLPYALSGIILFIALVPFTMKIWGAFAYPYTQLACCVVSLFINYRLFKKHFPQVEFVYSLRQAARVLAVNVLALFPSAVYAFYGAGTNVFMTLLAGGIIFLAGLYFFSYKSGDWALFKARLSGAAGDFNAAKSA